MNADEPRNLSKDLLQARNRFQTWRSQRPIGRPIPESLWNLAVKLVGQHGLSLTARVLPLDDYSLKKRTQEDRSQQGLIPDLPQEAVKTVLAQGELLCVERAESP